MKRQNKYSILIWMFAPVLSWYLIDRIIYYIFYKYPVFIVEHFQNFAKTKNKTDLSLNIGTFGDMYGGLNSFVSAIASLGAVVAILVQIWLVRQEKIKLANENSQKLAYLRHNLYSLEFETLSRYLFYHELVICEVLEEGVKINHSSIVKFKPILLSIKLLKRMDVEICFGLIRMIDSDTSNKYLKLYDSLATLENLLINLPKFYEKYLKQMNFLSFDFKKKLIRFSLAANLDDSLLEEILHEKKGHELEVKFAKLKEEDKFNKDDDQLLNLYDEVWISICELTKNYNRFLKSFDSQIIRDSLSYSQAILNKLPN